MSWKVDRWGGNANHKPRIVFAGPEDLARKQYREVYLTLRQGAVRLIDPQGCLVVHYVSGRGRSPGNISDFGDRL